MTGTELLKASPNSSETGSATIGSHSDRVVSLLEGAIEDGILLGGVLVATQAGNITVRCARGAKLPGSGDATARPSPIDIDTVFDLDGITAAIGTASIISRLVLSGKLAWTDRASRYLQALGVGNKSQITIAHLLSHTSGFPSTGVIFDELMRAHTGPRPGILASSGAKSYAYQHFVKMPLKFEPGAKYLHSDINSILLGQIIETITGLALEKAFFKFVAVPHGLKSISYIDIASMRRKSLEPMVEMFAPTGDCPKRGRLIAGEVWDESAWAMGGIAGHSGLFGIASEVHSWASEVMRGYKGESQIVPKEIVKGLWEPEIPNLKAGCKLGWDVSTKESGFVDAKIAPQAIVSSGSTGCSVFIDPARDVVAVFLSNAGFSGHFHRRFLPWRSELHTTLLDAH